MAGNQQFCLRWNNHQSTLVSVFDTLLESGTLVDCTLAAEGQYLKAHKVVLSACSPYLEAILSQHYEKHPIIILKDVSFIELKAMLDYMYRGEVNISQDQLGTFLKAAESLHIKGLTDNSGGGGVEKRNSEPPPRKVFNPVHKASPVIAPSFPQGLVVEQRPLRLSGIMMGLTAAQADSLSRDGSVSPKRNKRRRSVDDKSESDYSDSVPPPSLVQVSMSENASPPPSQPQNLAPAPPAALPLTSSLTNQNSIGGPTTEAVKVEPKSEDLSMNNDDSGGDERQFEEDEDDEMDSSKPGTSQGSNSHSTGVWNADTSAEDFPPGGLQEQEFLEGSPKLLSRPLVASLKAVNTYMARLNTTVTVPQGGSGWSGSTSSPASAVAAQRSSIQCPTCHKCYSSQHTLRRHMRLECGKEPQFHCPYCPRKTKQRYNLMLHIARAHKPDHSLQYNN